ncbi:MAG: hypothetical protein ACK5P7_01560 [Bdellovibrio sp.]|jgi:hypothetical protein
MDELKFVLKGFVIAILVTLGLQIKVGSETLEMKSDRLLHESSIGQFLNHTASGAALALKQGSHAVSKMMAEVLGSSKEVKNDQKWKAQTKLRALPPQEEETASEDYL